MRNPWLREHRASKELRTLGDSKLSSSGHEAQELSKPGACRDCVSGKEPGAHRLVKAEEWPHPICRGDQLQLLGGNLMGGRKLGIRGSSREVQMQSDGSIGEVAGREGELRTSEMLPVGGRVGWR